MKKKTTSKRQKHISEITDGLLSYVKKGKNIDMLPGIVAQLKKEISSSSNHGEVYSSIPLTDEQMDTVAGVLSKKMGTSVTLSNEIDERIIGGMIVKINDLLIDLSVRSKLAHLQQQIYG